MVPDSDAPGAAAASDRRGRRHGTSGHDPHAAAVDDRAKRQAAPEGGDGGSAQQKLHVSPMQARLILVRGRGSNVGLPWSIG
jgi:hypothetical protein